MRRILVTGANKGIGLAIAKAILDAGDDTFVYLGSRDAARGREAAATLGKPQRVEVVAVDVASDASVAAAAKQVGARLAEAGEKLYGLVNNAGINGMDSGKLSAVVEVNVRGIQRTFEAFLPLLDPSRGRVVNVTSGAGPMYVAACTPERQRFFVDPSMTWPRLRAFLDECVAAQDDPAALSAKGLGDQGIYGFSKAAANTLTLALAHEHPSLRVNACTPGFIETDMTRQLAASEGKKPSDMGMKPPADGAKAPIHLLFGDLEGNGRYYGSDAKRSPLDRYRSPGSPAYAGE